MASLSEEEVKELTKYAKDKMQVSAAQIQKDFDWGYAKARAGLEKLVRANKLVYEDGVAYKYVMSKSEEIKMMSDEINKAVKRIDKCVLESPSYEVRQEQDIIFNYVNIMNKLSESANRIKISDKQVESPPKNTKLSEDYKKLPDKAKELVKMAVKVAVAKKAARFGLFESSLRWTKKSEMGDAYWAAFEYMDKISEKEFKRIKYIFANCQPQ